MEEGGGGWVAWLWKVVRLSDALVERCGGCCGGGAGRVVAKEGLSGKLAELTESME